MSRTRAASRLSVAAAAVAATAVIAACGSNSHSSTHTTSSSGQLSQAQLQQDAFSFADCMRSHRVSNFPDPRTAPHAIKSTMNPNSALPRSPAFQSAATACQHLLPGGDLPTRDETHSRAQITALLTLARCLRTHGFPKFPDPTSTGQLTPESLANAGINVHQPAVLQAGDACVSVTHGMVTKADVAGFVAGQ